MKLFKKTMGVLLAASVLLSLSACAGKDNDKGSEGEATKIVLFQSKVEIIDQLEDMAEAYKEETGVEIEVWGTTGDDYVQQLKTKLANNQGPTPVLPAPRLRVRHHGKLPGGPERSELRGQDC